MLKAMEEELDAVNVWQITGNRCFHFKTFGSPNARYLCDFCTDWSLWVDLKQFLPFPIFAARHTAQHESDFSNVWMKKKVKFTQRWNGWLQPVGFGQSAPPLCHSFRPHSRHLCHYNRPGLFYHLCHHFVAVGTNAAAGAALGWQRANHLRPFAFVEAPHLAVRLQQFLGQPFRLLDSGFLDFLRAKIFQ